MKNIIIFIIFSIIEFIVTTFITNGIKSINYEYISLNYTSFKFSTKEDSPTGLNILIKLFFPTIYIIILSGILYNLKLNDLVNNIFFITPIYYILKWIFDIILLNRVLLINWKSELYCFIISSILSWFIYFVFISQTTDIFISLEELKNGIWLAIITFFFGIIFKTIYNLSYINLSTKKEKRENYIIKKFNKLENKFKKIILTKNKTLKNLTYAIMIYENFNRPIIIRFIEYIKFFIVGNATLGIMQVYSEKYITDIQSVKLGYNIIKDTFYSLNKKMNIDDKIKKVIFLYNKSNKYVEEVLYIYSVIENNT